jgi:hypothetical protein
VDTQSNLDLLHQYWDCCVNCDKWCWLRNVADPDKFAKDRARVAKFFSQVTAPFTFDKMAEAGADIGEDKLKGWGLLRTNRRRNLVRGSAAPS